MNEGDIYVLLSKRYSAEAGWAILPQVRSQTGQPYHATIRTADALAMQLYPSRGCTLHGFEIKVSRADWRKELENAEKAETIARYCHQWSIVAPKDVVPIEEVPAGWGLIEANADRLRTKKTGPLREPQPLPYEFLASIFRNFATRHEKAIREQLTAAYRDGMKQGELALKGEEERHAALRAAVKAFEAASGLHISTYGNGEEVNRELGAAVRAVRDGDRRIERFRRQLTNLHGEAKRVYEMLDAELNELVEAAA